MYWEIDNEIVCPALPPDINGQSLCNVTIEEGHERVKVTVQDPNNDKGIDSLNLLLSENNPPSLTYVEPTEELNHHSDQVIRFALIASDIEDTVEDLEVSWESNIDGELFISGAFSSDGYWEGTGYLSEGFHELTAKVSDSTVLLLQESSRYRFIHQM